MREPDPVAIEAACRQLRDFMLLQAQREGDDKREAVELMAAAVGMTPRTRELVARQLLPLLPIQEPYMELAWVMLGVTLGLSVADHQSDPAR